MCVIFFDFDGTISDSHAAAMDTYNLISAKFGYTPVADHDLEGLKSVTSREVLKKLGISPFKLPFILREARVKFQDRIHSLKPFVGIVTALEQLKDLGFQLGILTSNSKKNVVKFLDKNNLNIFNVVYCGASIFGKSKVIKKALKAGKFTPQNVIYVGDETRDIEAAHAAGIKVISVCWGFNTKAVLSSQNPDFMIEKPSQLSEVCVHWRASLTSLTRLE
jgi:phosphoglycolate phosphatase